MRRICVLFIAIIPGVASALLAFHYHSLFYCLLPVWALALGYFTSWRWGLLAGFLLFTGLYHNDVTDTQSAGQRYEFTPHTAV